jgi:hypothetical protein
LTGLKLSQMERASEAAHIRCRRIEITTSRKARCEYLYFKQEIAMKKMFLIAAIAAVTVIGSRAGAAELPTFGLTGFPITPHQVAVVGGTGVQEQAPIPALTFGGMPASPHQIAVLTPRPSVTAKAAAMKPTTVGLAAE